MPRDAFISYSHAADDHLAPAVQAGLARLAKPWYRRRALSVFRDKTGLSVNPGLWDSIARALDDSEYFVLLASPEAAASPWVNQEIGHWLRTKPAERILPVVTSGEWVWDPAARDFDWGRSTAVPAALRGVFREEPRHLDLSWARSEADLNVRNPGFRDAVAELAAPIHGRPKDELVGEDLRQHRRTVRLAAGAVAVLAALLVAAVVLAMVAVRSQRRAEESADRAREAQLTAEAERDRAEEQAALALARALAAQAQAKLAGEAELAILLGLESLQLRPTVDGRSALAAAAQRTDGLVDLLRGHGFVVWDVAVSPDGRLLASASGDGTVRVWDLEASPPVGTALDPPLVLGALDVAFSQDGRLLAAAGYGPSAVWRLPEDGSAAGIELILQVEGSVAEEPTSLVFLPSGILAAGYSDGTVRLRDAEESGGGVLIQPVVAGVRITSLAASPELLLAAGGLDGTIALWSPVEEAEPRVLATGQQSVLGLAFSPDGRTLASVDGGDAVALWDVATGRELGSYVSDPGGTEAFQDVVFSPDGQTLAAGGTSGSVYLWDVAREDTFARRRLRSPGAGAGGLYGLAFSPDGSFLAAGGSDAVVRLWRAAGDSPLGPALPLEDVVPSGAAVGPRGSALALVDACGRLLLWRGLEGGGTAGPEVLGGTGCPGSASVPVAFSPDGSRVAVGRDDGTVELRDVESGGRLDTGAAGGAAVRGLAFGPDGTVLAALGADGTVRLFRADRGEPFGSPLRAGAGAFLLAFPGAGALAVARATADGADVEIERFDLRSGRPTGAAATRSREAGAAEAFVRAALSPDGSLLALAYQDGTVRLWEAETGEYRGAVAGTRGSASTLAFSPDGRALALSDFDASSIRLLDTESLTPLADPLGPVHAGFPYVSFSPDGAALLGAGVYRAQVWSDLLWRGDLGRFRALLCPIAGRNLSRAEWDHYLPGREYERTCPELPAG